MSGSLNAAVVGLGWWGRQIIKTLRTSELIKVIRAVETELESARTFCDENGLSLTSDLASVLDDPDIDAIIIATPHLLHEEQVVASAQAGKHVFCEKPLALEAAAARRMLDACTSRSLVLGIGHERRFEGAMEEASRMVTSGELGTLLHVEANWSHNLFTGQTISAWRQDPAHAPAGTLTALGVHITDLLQSIAGRVNEVRAVAAHRSADFPSNDVLTVQFQFATGVTGVMSSLATTPFHGGCRCSAIRGGWKCGKQPMSTSRNPPC